MNKSLEMFTSFSTGVFILKKKSTIIYRLAQGTPLTLCNDPRGIRIQKRWVHASAQQTHFVVKQKQMQHIKQLILQKNVFKK